MGVRGFCENAIRSQSEAAAVPLLAVRPRIDSCAGVCSDDIVRHHEWDSAIIHGDRYYEEKQMYNTIRSRHRGQQCGWRQQSSSSHCAVHTQQRCDSTGYDCAHILTVQHQTAALLLTLRADISCCTECGWVAGVPRAPDIPNSCCAVAKLACIAANRGDTRSNMGVPPCCDGDPGRL